eukprot:02638.XXX_87749_87877_1 [CDS] Oithona nana genome sequencing.
MIINTNFFAIFSQCLKNTQNVSFELLADSNVVFMPRKFNKTTL